MSFDVLLIVLTALALIWFARADAQEYKIFQTQADTACRQRFFRTWILRGFFLFVVSSLGALWLLGEFSSVGRFPDQFRSIVATARGDLAVKQSSEGAFGLILGVSLALGSGLLAIVVKSRLRQPITEVRISSTNELIPRNAREGRLAFLLCINAGIGEELFFRLMLPLLILRVFESPWIAVAAAAVAFGLVHAYQGWKGMVLTTMMGLLFTFVYFLTENIWVTAAFHFANNVNALILHPWLVRRFSKGPRAASLGSVTKG